MRSSASDDAVHEWDLSDIHKFNDGSWNSIVTLDDNWQHFYSGIRVANVFLKEGTGLTFDDIKYNDNYSELMTNMRIIRMRLGSCVHSTILSWQRGKKCSFDHRTTVKRSNQIMSPLHHLII
jgi:hypothetical protein